MNPDDSTVFPLPFWFVLIVTLLFGCPANAEPIAQARLKDGTVITLHADKCGLAEVTNLPNRATWQSKTNSYEGCWRPSGFFPLILFFFREDKTVADIPAAAFEEVKGA